MVEHIYITMLQITKEKVAGGCMKREYIGQNVYEALQERLQFLFEEFDNIFVSFSGGKDSGLLLNLTLDFQRKYYPSILCLSNL